MRSTRSADEKYVRPAMEEIKQWQDLFRIIGIIVLALALALNWL